MASINVNSTRQLCAGVSFLALFPGFFFYHTAVGQDIIPGVLGGYFSPLSLLVVPVLFMIYVRDWIGGRLGRTAVDKVFWVYIAYFLLIVGLNIIDRTYSIVTTGHIVANLQYIACFLVFRLADFEDPFLKKMNVWALLLMAAVIFVLSVDGAFYLREMDNADEDRVAGYQGYARCFMVSAIVVVPFISSLWRRIGVYLIGVAGLFLIGARSEFVAFILLAMIVEVSLGRHRTLIFSVAAAVAVVVLLFSSQIIAALPENRVLQLFDVGSSTSWQARNELTDNAVQTIGRNPLLGEYGSYATETNAGEYAHNILSAWVDLGLIGFMYLLAMIAVPVVVLFYRLALRKPESRTSEFAIAFGTLFVTLLMLLTAKNFIYTVVGASMGAYARFVMLRRAPDFLTPRSEIQVPRRRFTFRRVL